MYSNLFIGSSQIMKWSLPKGNIVKRARYSHELFEYQIIPKHISYIVIYCGSRDIMNNVDPVENILNYINILLEKYPTLKITYLAILKSPYSLHFHDKITETNARLKYGLQNKVNYINANRKLVYSKYYLDDRLHLNQAGYKVWEDAINQKVNKFKIVSKIKNL